MNRWRHAGLLVVFGALVACSGHGGTAARDASGDAIGDARGMGADGAAGDAGIDASAGSAFPAMLVIGASSGDVPNPFTLAARGTADVPYGAISFSADVGTIDVGGGAAAAFMYATAAEGSYTLYDGFAVSPTSWDAFYLYCSGTTLTYVYDEKVGGHGMIYKPVSGGHCTTSSGPTVAQVQLPGFSIPTPAPVGGYTVSGPDIEVASYGVGSMTVGSSTLPLVVFDDVDCTACGGAGWYELHAIVWDAAQQRAVFVIVYLINGSSSSVELAYARSLPDLGDPIGTVTRPATWTIAHLRSKPPATVGLPPPSLRSTLAR